MKFFAGMRRLFRIRRFCSRGELLPGIELPAKHFAANERRFSFESDQVKIARFDFAADLGERNLKEKSNLFGRKRRRLLLALTAKSRIRRAANPNNLDFVLFDTDFGAVFEILFHRFECVIKSPHFFELYCAVFLLNVKIFSRASVKNP